jgi:hypothetical protein
MKAATAELKTATERTEKRTREVRFEADESEPGVRRGLFGAFHSKG